MKNPDEIFSEVMAATAKAERVNVDALASVTAMLDKCAAIVRAVGDAKLGAEIDAAADQTDKLRQSIPLTSTLKAGMTVKPPKG